MTTVMTLNDVRATLIAQGYSDEMVDAMLNLAGRMVLEGSLASKEDLATLRDEFTAFKIDTATQFVELRADMDTKFVELRADMDTKFVELRADMDTKFAELRTEMNEKFGEVNVQFAEMRTETSENINAASSESRNQYTSMLKWVVGVVIAGIGVNAAVVGIGLAVIAISSG